MSESLEIILERKLQSISYPKNSAKVQAARDAYKAGWQAAIDVTKERPGTHPADRHLNIRPERLSQIVDQMPKTGYGFLSGIAYDLRGTCELYARRGYLDHVEYAAQAGWQNFLETNPDQAKPEMLQKRKKALYDIYSYGSSDICQGRRHWHGAPLE